MNQILSYLYLGGKADAKDKEKLIKMKVKYILNCTPTRSQDTEAGCPNFYEKEKSFIYKRIPIFDNKGEDLLAHMTTAFNFIEEGKHYGNVLVHCHKGVSRSASFVIGYLMRKNEFTLDEALSHVQSCRPIVQPNSAFLEQLATYKPNEVSTENVDVSSCSAVDIGPSMGPFIEVPVGPMIPESDDGNGVPTRTADTETIDLSTCQPSTANNQDKRAADVLCNDENEEATTIKRSKTS